MQKHVAHQIYLSGNVCLLYGRIPRGYSNLTADPLSLESGSQRYKARLGGSLRTGGPLTVGL